MNINLNNLIPIKYINTLCYIGNISNKIIGSSIYIIIPIYIKLVYKYINSKNIYNRNIFTNWNNSYIIFNSTTNIDIPLIYNLIKGINNNNNINNISSNNKYKSNYIYMCYIFWYVYNIISINYFYNNICIKIYSIYNPIFNIDIFSSYIYSIHNNYSIDIIYSNIYNILYTLNKYDSNSNSRLFKYNMCNIIHNGRWNSTRSNINSTKFNKLCTFSSNYNNIFSSNYISKNEFGTNILNIKLYYYNNIIFNTEYIF